MLDEMQKIINNVDKSWSKDLIIRYLYVRLAPFFKRDLKYFLASEEEKYKEYEKGFINRGFDIVCSTLADYYVDLFSSLGINAKKIVANSAKIPLFALIVEGDNGWYFLDPINDLFSNQYGLETTEFGIIPYYQSIKNNYPYLIFFTSEYIKEMDSFLGIDKSLSNYFKNLHLAIANRNSALDFFGVDAENYIGLFQKRMEFVSENLINLGQVNGPFERTKLYLFLERIIFFKSEKRNLKIYLDKGFQIPKPVIEYYSARQGETSIYIEEKEMDGFILKRIK